MQYDVIIVGGGLVGLSLAHALQRASCTVALLERNASKIQDQRLFALNQTSCDFLKKLNIWPELIAHATPISSVHISRQGHFGSVKLNAADAGLPQLGYLIPAMHVEQALQQVVVTQANCDYYCPATVNAISQQHEQIELSAVSNNKTITLRAKCLIAADGSDSQVRTQLNIPVEQQDLHETAIVTQLTVSKQHNFVAYERFTKDGVLAILPMHAQQLALIWSLPNAAAENLLALSTDAFIAQVQENFGYRLGKIVNCQQRFHYPVRYLKAEQHNYQNVLLIGNAAHTLPPVAAQGFNLALWEVAQIAQIINQHPDDLLHLKQLLNKDFYAQQEIAIKFSKYLHQMMQGKMQQWFSQLITLGMLSFENIKPFKKYFLKKMLGSRFQQTAK